MVFWKWINLNKLAVVTTASVYFIDITKEGPEQKIFDRGGALAESNPVQVIGITASSD